MRLWFVLRLPPATRSMLERVNQLIELRQDFLHLGVRGRVRERQTQVRHALDVVGAATGNRGGQVVGRGPLVNQVFERGELAAHFLR